MLPRLHWLGEQNHSGKGHDLLPACGAGFVLELKVERLATNSENQAALVTVPVSESVPCHKSKRKSSVRGPAALVTRLIQVSPDGLKCPVKGKRVDPICTFPLK